MVTLDYQNVTAANDGWWGSTTFNNTDTEGYIGYYLYARSIFTRFSVVTIPVGSIITAAYISTYRYAVTGTPSATLYFEKSANPAAPTSVAAVNGRTKTTNNISIAFPSVGWTNSNDISAIIQELVDAYDYSAGKAMLLLLIGTGSGSNYSRLDMCEMAGSFVYGIKLHIEYTLPEGGVGLVGEGLASSDEVVGGLVFS